MTQKAKSKSTWGNCPFVCGMKKNFLLFVKKLNENIEECDKITLVLTRGDRGNNAAVQGELAMMNEWK